MGMGRLNVWITEPRDPCTISSDTWRVNIAHCDGRILEWCGRTYANLPAPCGHLEIPLPPGCYVVRGARSVRFVGTGPGRRLRGNVITDAGIVTVCCDKEACVTLYPPEIHLCGWLFVVALRDHLANKLIPAKVANEAIRAVHAVMEQEEMDARTQRTIEHLERTVAKLGKR